MPKVPKIAKDLIKTAIVAFIVLFSLLILSFIFLKMLSGDIVLLILRGRGIIHPTPEQYQEIVVQYGLDKPLIIQFLRYLARFFIGAWDNSYMIPGNPIPVGEILGIAVPRTFEVLLLPLIVGTIAGILIGLLFIKTRFKWLKRIIQILNTISYSLPIIFIAILYQFFAQKSGILPPYGYKTIMYSDPPFKTGFLIWDSILAGQWYLVFDIAAHYILPGIILGFMTSTIVTKFIRINAKNKAQKTSILYNTSRIALVFGLIFGFTLIIEVIFGLPFFSDIFFTAFYFFDFFLIEGCLFVIILIILFLTIGANILYSIYHLMAEKKVWPTTWIRKKERIQIDEIKNNNQKLNTSEQKERNPTHFKNFKKYFLNKLKSPITIIGLVIFLFFLIISIFPQILTPYSLVEAGDIYPDAWAPPSPGHPLGQGKYGRDILALMVYGIQESLIFGILATLIGVGGGLHFGYFANNQFYDRKFHRWFIRWPILGFMLLFYIMPIFILVPLLIFALESLYMIFLLTIGILLIPLFTRIFVRIEYNIFEILKKLIIYIPFFVGFSILINISLGFIGFYDPDIFPQLGQIINDGRIYLYDAPWATLMPGLAIFFLALGLFFLYEGFQDFPISSRKR